MMEAMQGVKGFSDSREEEEEEEATEEIITREENSSSRLQYHHQQEDYAAVAAASSNFMSHHQQHTKQQIDFMDLSLRGSNNNKDIINNNNNNNNGEGCESNLQQQGASNQTSCSSQPIITEKEHMFDKVVTPSDVGKLNRLVIPKQHAEKYFPLDSTSNEKGLLLNFEDRNGKLWRFRYSYWNSSQSYVMTKGWSRFVKEKKLDAGDIVSFQRGVGELFRHRLFIDWRRRPDHQYHHHHHGVGVGIGVLPDPSAAIITPLFLPNQPHHLSQYSTRWGGRLYSLPSSSTPQPIRQHHHLEHLNNNNHHNMYHQPFHHHHHHHLQHQLGGSGNHNNHYYNNNYNEVNGSGSGSLYYLRSATTTTTPSMQMSEHQSFMTRQQQQQHEGGGTNNSIAPMIIDSVPVAHHHHHHHHQQQQQNQGVFNKSGSSSTSDTNGASKRLRLFGVNMECGSSPSSEDTKFVALATANASLPSSSLLPPTLSSTSARFGDNHHHHRGEAASIFDLDPSLQYQRQ